MRKPFHLLVFVLALALAYATAQTSGSSPSNQTATTPSQPSQDQTQKPETQSGSPATPTSSTDVQGQIQSALKNEPSLSNANITVSVTDDAVELTGTVASTDEKRAAKKIAKSYAGTRKVKDSLTVNGDSKKSPPGTMGFVSAGAYSQTQSSQSGTTGSTHGTGQSTSPSPNTSQSPPTPNEPANSQTNSNSSPAQTPASPEQLPTSQQAPVAAAVAGGDIQMQIQNALQKEPTLSNDSISVSVTDNTIELNGTVATGKEKQTATRIAQSYAGNRKVKEHLTVSANSPPGSMNNPSALPDTTNPNPQPSAVKPPR